MGLLQNISLKNAEPIDRTGDTSEFWPSQLNWALNKYVGYAGIDQKSGVPNGYSPPYSFTMPIKEGGMSSYSGIIGAGDISEISNLIKAMSFAPTTIVGSGTISNASLSLLVQLEALAGQIVGSGGISESSDLKLISNLAATIIGAGGIVDPSLNLIAWCNAIITGSGDIVATMKGFANMSATITSAGELVTAESCAAAVWNAIASSYNDAGTMGQKLNSAAVGGVDYDALAEAVLDAAVTGRPVGSLGKVVEDTKKKANMIPGLY
jgi:hypothetical protein